MLKNLRIKFLKTPVGRFLDGHTLAIACGLFGAYFGSYIEDIYKGEFDLF